jgi:plasmid stabilization system protein ParE
MDNIYLAKEDYWNNIDYLLENWPAEVAASFITNVDEYVRIIAHAPQTFSATNYKNIHSVPIVPQITLFYRVTENKHVELVRFWNNAKDRQNLNL